MLTPRQLRLVIAVAAFCGLLMLALAAGTSRSVPQPKLQAGALRFNAASAMAYTRALAELHPDRVTGTQGSRRAARFLKRTFESLGYRVRLQRFPVWIYGKRVEGENVVATLARTSAPSRYVAVLAHYDHPRTTHQAAEDDASGVGAVLELARATRGRIADPVFVATDAEEIGMIGARNLIPFFKERGDGSAISIDYLNAGASHAMQLTASGQFGGYTPIALRQIVREAAQQQSRTVLFPYGAAEWIDRAVERSFQDQGPLNEAQIPAVNIVSVPADVHAARRRYHTPADVYAHFEPAVFAMVGRTAERTMLTAAIDDTVGAGDGFMITPGRYLPYATLWWILFLPLVPLIVAVACAGPERAPFKARLIALTVPAFAAYVLVRQLALHNVIPRSELYPAPPKDPSLYHPAALAVLGIVVALVVGYGLLALRPTPLFGKGTLLLWATALALAAFAVNPFGLWLYLGIFLCAAALLVERTGAKALAINFTMLALAAVPFAIVVWYFAREIFVGPYVVWYLVLQAAYGTWSFWVVGAAIVAAVLWVQYLRLALVPFYAVKPRFGANMPPHANVRLSH